MSTQRERAADHLACLRLSLARSCEHAKALISEISEPEDQCKVEDEILQKLEEVHAFAEYLYHRVKHVRKESQL
jgi:hypothetical protein